MTSLLETKLPETLLEEVLSYLSFTQRRRVLGLSRALWVQRYRIDQKTKHVSFEDEDEGRELFLNQPFQSATRLRHMFGIDLSQALISLTLDKCSNDGLLHVALVQLQLFPNLNSLRMRQCDLVTDFGLDCISRSAAAARHLEVVDITFCHNTTYSGTFPLRERVTNLKLLRRQPEWLDGRFETPFGGARSGAEIHTYYADGSFSFNRDSQSNGFVCQLHPWDEDFLGDKLQYNNFRAPLGWPEWTQFCYRPGVCLLRLPPTGIDDESSTDNHHQHHHNHPTVLVGQYMRGLRAPKNRPLMERAKELVPLGHSRYFDKTTEELLPFEDAESTSQHYNLDNVIMVSRMRVKPLESDQLMPPPSLVQACQNTCRGMQSYGQDFLLLQEERLDQLLSGDEAL